MTETLRGEVLHVVAPGDRAEYDLEGELETLAESRYILVCRDGGAPSWVERVRSFLLGQPIEPVTVVAETAVTEGEEITATVEPTALAGVYEAVELY